MVSITAAHYFTSCQENKNELSGLNRISESKLDSLVQNSSRLPDDSCYQVFKKTGDTARYVRNVLVSRLEDSTHIETSIVDYQYVVPLPHDTTLELTHLIYQGHTMHTAGISRGTFKPYFSNNKKNSLVLF